MRFLCFLASGTQATSVVPSIDLVGKPPENAKSCLDLAMILPGAISVGDGSGFGRTGGLTAEDQTEPPSHVGIGERVREARRKCPEVSAVHRRQLPMQSLQRCDGWSRLADGRRASNRHRGRSCWRSADCASSTGTGCFFSSSKKDATGSHVRRTNRLALSSR